MPKTPQRKKKEAAVHALFDRWAEVAKGWETEELHAANFEIPILRFFEGTEDDCLAGLVGLADDETPVPSFSIAQTSNLIRYDFLDHTFEVAFNKDEVTAELMIGVCCGLLVHHILPKGSDYKIPKKLDFQQCVFRRISWNPSHHAWRLFFSFGSDQKP